MVKGLLSAIALLVLCATAQANPAPAPETRATSAKAHNYWLSDGLNRLVFWKPPVSTETPVIRH